VRLVFGWSVCCRGEGEGLIVRELVVVVEGELVVLIVTLEKVVGGCCSFMGWKRKG
jgi:hypothetical protein